MDLPILLSILSGSSSNSEFRPSKGNDLLSQDRLWSSVVSEFPPCMGSVWKIRSKKDGIDRAVVAGVKKSGLWWTVTVLMKGRVITGDFTYEEWFTMFEEEHFPNESDTT